MKKLRFTLILVIAYLLTSCEKQPAGYDNLYLQIDPTNQETLLISSAPVNGWEEVVNCEDYCYTFKTWTDAGGIERFRFEYAGSFEFMFFYFSGFNNVRFDQNGESYVDLEMPITPISQSKFSVTIEGELLPAETYELSLSFPKNF